MAPSTCGTFLRSFTFGHVRQLDRLFATILSRAWAAGAGPGDAPMIIDVDSTVCEVHGYHKGGAAYGYTHQLGYHPLLATRAVTGEILHVRQRKGSAASGRGAKRFIEELVARVRRAGASGALTLRADSGFFSWKVIDTLKAKEVRFSITVPKNPAVTRAIEAIDEETWTPIGYPDGGEAHVAETTYKGERLVVRPHPPQRFASHPVARLAAPHLHHQPSRRPGLPRR
jgi:PII-like signaling protein